MAADSFFLFSGPGADDSALYYVWRDACCLTADRAGWDHLFSSPALIAEYQTALPDKRLLQRKFHEFYLLALPAPGDSSPLSNLKS